MLIAYDPMNDVLSITLQAAPAVQTQQQGTVNIGFDAAGEAVAVSISEASTLLWENGGQVSVLLPEKTTVVTETTVSPATESPATESPAGQPGVAGRQVVERRTAI